MKKKTERHFTLILRCENAAFGETDAECSCEVSRLLFEVSQDVVGFREKRGFLRDANGNKIGDWQFVSTN